MTRDVLAFGEAPLRVQAEEAAPARERPARADDIEVERVVARQGHDIRR